MTGRMWHFIERRSVLILLATVIGLVSAFLLWATLRMAYSDYWYEPKLKAADPGLYIYPPDQIRDFRRCRNTLVHSWLGRFGLLAP